MAQLNKRNTILSPELYGVKHNWLEFISYSIIFILIKIL